MARKTAQQLRATMKQVQDILQSGLLLQGLQAAIFQNVLLINTAYSLTSSAVQARRLNVTVVGIITDKLIMPLSVVLATVACLLVLLLRACPMLLRIRTGPSGRPFLVNHLCNKGVWGNSPPYRSRRLENFFYCIIITGHKRQPLSVVLATTVLFVAVSART